MAHLTNEAPRHSRECLLRPSVYIENDCSLIDRLHTQSLQGGGDGRQVADGRKISQRRLSLQLLRPSFYSDGKVE
jgi:hypothetical protein